LKKFKPPTPPDDSHIRYSEAKFPSYHFIPSINAHPTRDPKGHSYGETEPKLKYLAPENWEENQAYLFGIDLYNYAYWWESHEQWEGIWHTTQKDSVYGQFLQGLIQISAAFIKWQLHQHEGMKRLYEIGFSRLSFVKESQSLFMGVDLDRHLSQLSIHFATILTEPAEWQNPLENYPFISVCN
jgi:uncharacterized protein